ncbi:hypothetical protein MKX08_010634 [Trichoderma sp. CBMAI-0020]|nr:hypothetical protein MKX08_010634 [Trichoderma sp. CBMAI-0020]
MDQAGGQSGSYLDTGKAVSSSPVNPLHRPPQQEAAADAAMPSLGDDVGRITPLALGRPRRVYALEHTFSEC